MLKLIANRSQVCLGLTTALISCVHGQGSTFSFIRAAGFITQQWRSKSSNKTSVSIPSSAQISSQEVNILSWRPSHFPLPGFLFLNRQALFVCRGYVYFAEKNFLRRVKQPPNSLQKSTKHLQFKHTQYFESCDATFRVALLKLHNMAPTAINFHSATCLPPRQRIGVGRITRVVAELPDHVDSGVYVRASLCMMTLWFAVGTKNI